MPKKPNFLKKLENEKAELEQRNALIYFAVFMKYYQQMSPALKRCVRNMCKIVAETQDEDDMAAALETLREAFRK